MNEKDVVIEKFIENCLIAEQTQLSGDFKKGNKSQEILLSLYARLKEEPQLTQEVVDELLLNDNPYVLYTCSVYATVLNYRRGDAMKVLEKVASMEVKLTSLHAETTLEMIESGELFELYGVSK